MRQHYSGDRHRQKRFFLRYELTAARMEIRVSPSFLNEYQTTAGMFNSYIAIAMVCGKRPGLLPSMTLLQRGDSGNRQRFMT